MEMRILVGKINVIVFCVIQQKCGVSMIIPPLNILQTALETEVETLRKSVDNLQGKQKIGLEIENHLKKKVYHLEKKKILSEEKMKGLLELVHHHSQHRAHIINFLDEGYSHLKSITDAIEEKIKQFEVNREQKLISPQTDAVLHESECRDVHINNDLASYLITKVDVPGLPNTLSVVSGDTSEEGCSIIFSFAAGREVYTIE